MKTVSINITIGPRLSFMDRATRFFFFIAGVMAIPVINELVLSGHWSINLIGFLVGIMFAMAMVKGLSPFTKTFPNREAAANYVRLVNLETGESDG